jgi:methionyl-tRNA synthetase
VNPIIESLAAEIGLPVWAMTIALVWIATWKGIALWKAAKNNHLVWFVALLIIQSMGLFEIFYIFLFSKIKLPEVRAKGGKKNASKFQKTSKSKTFK